MNIKQEKLKYKHDLSSKIIYGSEFQYTVRNAT